MKNDEHPSYIHIISGHAVKNIYVNLAELSGQYYITCQL